VLVWDMNLDEDEDEARDEAEDIDDEDQPRPRRQPKARKPRRPYSVTIIDILSKLPARPRQGGWG
ncbi:hypothetical protein FS749_006239, partial [Ceratobasidium sp. UAMH 11750]